MDEDFPQEVEYELQKVFDELNRLRREKSRSFPKNILLVGRPEAGKSSLINLFHSAFNGEYSEIAQPGSDGTGGYESVTQHLLHYPKMGLSNGELDEFKENYEFDEDFVPPSIIDMPGMMTINGEKGRASEIDYVLRSVIEGNVPTETRIAPVLCGEQKLLIVTRDERLKVDSIIFVISIKQDIDVQMLRNAMKIVSGNNGRRKVIPYIVIFTHMDCVGGISDDKVTLETANIRKKIVADILELKIITALPVCSHELSNYNDKDEIDEIRGEIYRTDLKKHISAIQALCKLCLRKEIIDDIPVPSCLDMIIDRTSHVLKSVWDYKFIILVSLLLVLFSHYINLHGWISPIRK